MPVNSSPQKDPGEVESETGSPPPELLGSDVARVVHEVRQLVHDHLELVTLEARLSVNTLLRMAVVSIITALVLVSGWLALLGSAAFGLLSIGATPAIALLFVAMANFLLAIIGRYRIRKMSHWLGWPATQRAIKPDAANDEKRGGE
jgi:hypothetical protein